MRTILSIYSEFALEALEIFERLKTPLTIYELSVLMETNTKFVSRGISFMIECGVLKETTEKRITKNNRKANQYELISNDKNLVKKYVFVYNNVEYEIYDTEHHALFDRLNVEYLKRKSARENCACR